MPDMVVRLYALPEVDGSMKELSQAGITVRRAYSPEKRLVIDWIVQKFSKGWASETEAAFANHPVSCFIAIKDNAVIGFACHDASAKNLFGPTGVDESRRGQGIGKALLLSCLHAMRHQGYQYAIIGGVGPADYYRKTVGAQLIEGSEPGIFPGLLKTR